MPYEGRETGDRSKHEEIRQVDLGESHGILSAHDNITRKGHRFEACIMAELGSCETEKTKKQVQQKEKQVSGNLGSRHGSCASENSQLVCLEHGTNISNI